MASEYAIGLAARIWCEPKHSSKVMDPDFAMSIAEIIDQERQASFIEGRDAAIDNAAMTAHDILSARYLPMTADDVRNAINALVGK